MKKRLKGLMIKEYDEEFLSDIKNTSLDEMMNTIMLPERGLRAVNYGKEREKKREASKAIYIPSISKLFVEFDQNFNTNISHLKKSIVFAGPISNFPVSYPCTDVQLVKDVEKYGGPVKFFMGVFDDGIYLRKRFEDWVSNLLVIKSNGFALSNAILEAGVKSVLELYKSRAPESYPEDTEYSNLVVLVDKTQKVGKLEGMFKQYGATQKLKD